MKFNPEKSVPAAIISLLIGALAFTLCLIELEDRVDMQPPTEYVFWEEDSSQTSQEASVESVKDTAALSSRVLPQTPSSLLPESLPKEQPSQNSQDANRLESQNGVSVIIPPPAPPPSSKIYLSSEEASSGNEVWWDEGDFGENADSSSKPPEEPEADPSRVINLNTASVEDLCTLKGIGEVLAKRIIEYREQAGGFTQIEDIMNVKGIAEGKFAAIKERITI